MTLPDHLRLIWPFRMFVMMGESLVFDDGQPAPSEDELTATRAEALRLYEAERARSPRTYTQASFFALFTQAEQVAFLMDQSPGVALLRYNFALTPTISTDSPALLAGLETLVEVGILTEQRKEALLYGT